MGALDRTCSILKEGGVKYDLIEHPEEFTAMAEASASGVAPREWAKSVAVRLDGRPALAVLPATRRLDVDRLAVVAGVQAVEIVPERELKALYPDCDLGAIPPFGNLYDQSTFVDVALREDELIGFHAGTHTETLVMAYPDFERIANAVPGRIALSAEE